MTFVIQMVEFVGCGPMFFSGFNGTYIKNIEDVDDFKTWKFVDKAEDAMTFEQPHDALTFYNRQSTKTPIRPDGRQNKPLTAFTVLIKPI